MDLGAASISLDADAAHFVPPRLHRWRGVRPVSIPYARIEGLSMTEPQGLAPGRLTVRLADGAECCSMSFGPFRLRAMRSIYAEMWRRSRAAHEPA